jgi:hypothetical protein
MEMDAPFNRKEQYMLSEINIKIYCELAEDV